MEAATRNDVTGKEIQKLVDSGVIQGEGYGITEAYLRKPTSRLQAGILYLRIAGLEEEALSYAASSSYENASVSTKMQPLLAYLFEHPYLGWGSDSEPLGQISAEEYGRVLLTLLGYYENIDYPREEVLSFAKEKGLNVIAGGGLMNNERTIKATYEALSMQINQGNETLAEQYTASRNKANFKPQPLIETVYGKIRGTRQAEAGVLEWLGVPYAQSPVHELRWKAPRELASWDGVIETTRYGNSCVQSANGKTIGEEDCLYLNIWRPDNASSNLPVLVFAHGGGNMSGSGQDFKGDQLARETNSIIISVNYRLGAMGFFRHPALRTGDAIDDSGNYGLLDILHSLTWVRDNIESFGGNPNNVTLSGQSAGARNVLAAMISPLGEGLFHKAVVLSGGLTTADPSKGDAKSDEILSMLLIKHGKAGDAEEAREWIQSQSAEAIDAFLRGLDAAEYAQAYGQVSIQMEPFPHLFEDGAVIPKEGFKRIDSGHYHKVPVILGSTATEFSVFALSDPDFLPSIMDGSLFKDSQKMKLYSASVKYGSGLYAGFNAERVAERLAGQPGQPPVYAYRFGWGTRDGVIDPGHRFLMGARHGADIMFYTGDVATVTQYFPKGYVTEENEPGREALTAIVRGYVKQFLYTGNPNGEGLPLWNEWSDEDNAEKILKLDADDAQAIVAMSAEYLKNEDILAEMEADPSLSAEQKAWIKDQIFAGRFFWKP
ncbi:carboxylesterase/lipase family protein [Paenibacillus sp.]|uniref:carboxylesterase/lipase family protein n=1 Tax=Paenibacillus sp. TaxID=58172 RepID=UPI002D7932C1|nr:carboxylesterase family protein [Paenibacillus sp.]